MYQRKFEIKVIRKVKAVLQLPCPNRSHSMKETGCLQYGKDHFHKTMPIHCYILALLSTI